MHDAPEDAQPRPAARPGRAGWLYLALFVVAAVLVGIDPIADRLLPPPPAGDPALAPTPDIDLFSRFGLGVKALAPSVGGQAFLGQLDDLRKDPQTITDRDDRIAEIAAHLRTAIAIGELYPDPDPASSDTSETPQQGALRQIEAVRPDIAALDPPDPELAADADTLIRIYTEGPGALTSEERDRLLDRHGATARIALANGLPDSDPQRAPLVRAGVRSVIAVGAIGALAAVGLVIGIALLITAIALRESGKLRPRFLPDRTSAPRTHDAFLETVILFLSALSALKVIHILVGMAIPEPPTPVRIAMYSGYWIIALAVFWPRVRGVDRATLLRSIGWARGRGIAREVLAGLASYLAFLPVVCVGFLVLILLAKLLNARPSHPLVDSLPSASPWELVMLYSIAVVWAPVVEETIFRGALYNHLRRYVGAILSGLCSAFLFAAIHPQGITTIPALMALAIGFAACREWRGSLIGSITGHALHNSVLVTLNLALFG